MTEEERMKLRVPFWCPVCSGFMKGDMSTKAWYRYQCCGDCYIAFVEGREDRWSAGWRPDEQHVKDYYSRLQTSE